MKTLLLTVMLLLSGIAIGQSESTSTAEAFKKRMMETEANLKAMLPIKAQVIYQYHEELNAAPSQIDKRIVTTDGLRQRVIHENETEEMFNDSMIFLVDHIQKAVYMGKVKFNRDTSTLLNVDTFTAKGIKITRLNQAATERWTLTYTDPNALYSKIVISINKQKNIVDGIQFYGLNDDEKEAKLEVKLTVLQSKAVSLKQEFSPKNYVKLEGKGKFSLVARFTGYKLINQQP